MEAKSPFRLTGDVLTFLCSKSDTAEALVYSQVVVKCTRILSGDVESAQMQRSETQRAKAESSWRLTRYPEWQMRDHRCCDYDKQLQHPDGQCGRRDCEKYIGKCKLVMRRNPAWNPVQIGLTGSQRQPTQENQADRH